MPLQHAPILVVLRPEPAEVVREVLAHAGVDSRLVTPRLAADLVGRSEGDLVVCERSPGWQALILRVENAGGAALLLGPPPSDDEPLHALLGAVECVEDIDQLVDAIQRARIRRDQRLVRSAGENPEEDSLEQRLKISEQVARFAQSIVSQLDLPHVVAETVARICDLCDADRASVLLVDPQTGQLLEAGPEERLEEGLRLLRAEDTHALAWQVAREAKALCLSDPAGNPEWDAGGEASDAFRTGSLLAVPLLHRGDVVGVLEARRSLTRAPLAASRLHRLELLAPHVAIAVQNARVNAGLRAAQAEVLAANAALEEKVVSRTSQIARAKREWESTFDAIQEPLAVQDGFTLRRANRAYARHAGVPVMTLPGRRCYELLAGRQSPCPQCPLTRAEGEPSQSELELADGTSLSVNAFRLESAPGAGRQAGGEATVVHYRDITGEKGLARRVRESERLVALGQLASGAAHEINNPMGFLSSNLQQLQELFGDLRGTVDAIAQVRRQLEQGQTISPDALLGDTTPESLQENVEDALEIIEESLEGARRITAIVKGLRELARDEVSQVTPSSVNDSLSRVLNRELGADVLRVERLEAKQPVLVAPLQLDQLFEHVIRNARQALGADLRVEVRTRDVDGMVQIDIEDHGEGISAEHLHRVFEPFFTTRGIGRGIGLGLTVAYGIVQRVGGQIEVHSRQGHGTLVQVKLPRAERRVDSAEAQAARVA